MVYSFLLRNKKIKIIMKICLNYILASFLRMPYQTIRKLYQGNDGPVYLIKEGSKEKVLKRYESEQSKYGVDPGLLMECTILNLVKDKPNLLQLDRIERRGEDTDLFIEALDGEIVDLILTELSVPQIKSVMKQIINGLLFLHSNAIIHNDIKPKNILYRDEGRGRYTVKVIDFGLAYLVNFPYYRARKIQTTHHYTPPEYIDHREIGRVSVNSDMFSLGIIFYYLINPDGYKQTDYLRDYDFIFDVNQVDWRVVKKKVGKVGTDLLEQMLEVDPEKRITSLRAINHPFLKKTRIKAGSQSGGERSQSGGGGVRRWEIANLMSKNEWKNRTNGEEFLEMIVQRSKQTRIKSNDVTPMQKIPNDIWNMMYDRFDDLNLKFITLNYGSFLLMTYLKHKRIRADQFQHLAFACLFLSSKLNEYRMGLSVKRYSKNTQNLILKFERELINIFDWALPLPILLTKEITLYSMFLEIIYDDKHVELPYVDKIRNFYHVYYLLELVSSLTYFSPELMGKPKEEIIRVVLSFWVSDIDHSKRLKDDLVDLIKSKSSIYWLERDLLRFLNIN
jgi:serine/threonine protein kinase